MRIRTKILITTAVLTVVLFMLAPNSPAGESLWETIYPADASTEGLEPEGAQLGLLMAIGLIEAAATGLGIAWLVFGWPITKNLMAPNTRLGVAMHLSSSWLLLNWWIHDNMHIQNGLNLNGLIMIDYVFHGTLIVAGIILIFGMTKIQGNRAPAARTA